MGATDRGVAGAQSAAVRAGLIGHGIGPSRTPRMHEEEGRAQGIAYRYDRFDTHEDRRSLPDILGHCEAAGYAGVNITHPFKQYVLAHVDDASPAVTAIGGANTVVFAKGKWIAHNTDHWGFKTALAQQFGNAPKEKVVLIGAGGAGCAVAHALLESGVAHLNLQDVDGLRCQALVDDLRGHFGPDRVSAVPDLASALAAADGVVNATPLGMADYPGSAVPLACLRADLWVADIVYFPLETKLLAQARATGCRVMSGAGMAVFQAVRAFELFTGRAADASRMQATFASFDA